MIVSIAEEMNPTRRNTMEDVHVAHPPGDWNAPDDDATFLGVYDGHGGRLIADYLDDHLAENIAKEWSFAESEQRNKDLPLNGGKKQQSKKRRIGDDNNRDCDIRNKENDGPTTTNSKSDNDDENEDETIQIALERAFLLTDIRSRMDGITTSGATVVCCVVIPKFSNDNGRKRLASISIHAANAGDARAVLSSCTARPINSSGGSHRTTNSMKQSFTSRTKSKLPNPELPNELPSRLNKGGPAVRITNDHKADDPSEIARIESSGGIMLRGRVLGVLAVARSLGDHGLKEYVIGRPYLSSTVVRVEKSAGSDCSDDGNDNNTRRREETAPSSSGPHTDGEFLIVACDGLWDVMKDQDAVDYVRNHVNENGQESRDKVASFLIEEALQRGSTDNITVIVYWL